MKVGYVVKRYPRFSETFIVHEILAHEAAGLDVEIFALRPTTDVAFQEAISRVRAPVTFLDGGSGRAGALWARLEEAHRGLPDFFERLSGAVGESSRELCQGAALALLAGRRGITHLHAHFATSAASVARLASLFSGIPYTMTAHAKDIFHESVQAEDLGRKLSDATATVTVSNFNLRYLRENFPEAAPRIQRIYNGLPLDDFPYREPVRREPSVVAVGRLVEKKGFDVLIDACAILRDRGRHLPCRIIGEGEDREALARQIAERHLASTVQLVGPLPQREVIREVARASALAAPCVVGDDGNRDGLPTVLIEAMALGTPCVATDVTGIPELVRDGASGLIVPQHSPERLAEAIERLLDGTALRLRLAGAARELVEQDFDVRRSAARQRALFAAAGGEQLELRRAS